MDSNLYYLEYTAENIDFKTTDTLVWRIPDFMWLMNNQTNREIRTKKYYKDLFNKDNSVFKDDKKEERKFQLKIRFVGQENDLMEIYYLCHKSVLVECSFYIWMKSSFSQDYRLKVTLKNQWARKQEWQLLAVELKTRLLAENILYDGNVKFKLEFVVCNSTADLTKTVYFPKNKEELMKPERQLNNDLEKLLMKTHFSDVTLKSIEGVEIPAHKIFLTTRSAVFKAHFDHNTMESVTNVIETEFETKVIKDVLSYIYTDVAHYIDEIPHELLNAADFYQLNGLKKLSERALEKKLSLENAIETLVLANIHGAKYLQKKTLKFINDGLTREIVHTEGWKTLQSAEIAKSVYEYDKI